MEKEKKDILMKDVRKMRIASGVSGVGFLLYMGAAALEWILVKDLIAIVFAVIAIWTFFSVLDAWDKGKKDQTNPPAVTYNLLWGTGALAIMLATCAYMGIKLRLGL